MSRYCGKDHADKILGAAEQWKSIALIGGASIFTKKFLWSADNLELVDRFYVQRPDEGKGTLYQKLEAQLAPAPPEVKQLVAEMFWLMYLCPSSLSAEHKRGVVSEIWSWSGEAPPSTSPLLQNEVLSGVGSAGPGFNQNQWRELVFVTRVLRAFRGLSDGKQTELLADPWKFSDWIGQIQDAGARQFRHMLLFLLFPDNFERIFGQRDRRAVAVAFAGRNAKYVNGLEAAELDRLLFETRASLEKQYGTKELDYYVPPLDEQWQRPSVSTVAGDIAADHIRKAITEIDRDGIPASAGSTGYDLIYGAKRYPPKLVFSLATKYATGEEIDRSSFSGGEDSAAVEVLRNLGFHIEAKDALQQLLKRFLEQASRGEQTTKDYPGEYRGLELKVSFGKGNIARIPWIAFLAEGQEVSEGIYPVFLFFKEQKVLALCYGISETTRSSKKWTGMEGRDSVDEWFEREFGRAPDRYGESFVRATYRTDQELPFLEVAAQLDVVITEYQQLMGLTELQNLAPSDEAPVSDLTPLEVRADLLAAAESFSSALQAANVSFGHQHDNLIRVVLASLVTKPFLILTGMSGSGKTQIAIRLGEWLGARLHVAAVRPDWTGSESLFGYEDALRTAEGGRSAWAVPPPLEFMLRALHDPNHPYLLVLDEMNLAHVERYFADVLSGMESRQPCLPNLKKESDGCWRVSPGAESRILFPKNLWIIGTVNIDETTYMFSPKVLDRASTFEFRVSSADLIASTRKPVPCSSGEAALLRGLQAIANDDQWQERAAPEFREALATRLRRLHELLSRYGLEFGHRAFYESIRLGALLQFSGITEPDAILDRILIQRVLPRLHGSRRKLEQPLISLAHFARDLPEVNPTDADLASFEAETAPDNKPVKLPMSHDKIMRMLRSIRLNQFASFTE